MEYCYEPVTYPECFPPLAQWYPLQPLQGKQGMDAMFKQPFAFSASLHNIVLGWNYVIEAIKLMRIII